MSLVNSVLITYVLPDIDGCHYLLFGGGRYAKGWAEDWKAAEEAYWTIQQQHINLSSLIRFVTISGLI